jgi:RNA-directed DNA polymerase
MLALVRPMLKAAVVMPDGTKVAVQEGTPQGGPLSPLLSNVVLDELDGELARRGLRSFATPMIARFSCAASAPGGAS